MQVIVSGVWVTGSQLKRIHFVLLVLIRRWRLSKNCSIEVKLSLRLEAAVFGEDPTEYKMVSSGYIIDVDRKKGWARDGALRHTFRDNKWV